LGKPFLNAPIAVEADSTDSAILINGNEVEEELGVNEEGTPLA